MWPTACRSSRATRFAAPIRRYRSDARRLRLEIAADYLVMAAWLAYLKSRLLLPAEEADEGPSGEELALALARRLKHLEAIREAGRKLMGFARLGIDVFPRGIPEALS